MAQHHPASFLLQGSLLPRTHGIVVGPVVVRRTSQLTYGHLAPGQHAGLNGVSILLRRRVHCYAKHPSIPLPKAHLFERRRILAKETNLMEKLPDARNSVMDESCRVRVPRKMTPNVKTIKKIPAESVREPTERPHVRTDGKHICVPSVRFCLSLPVAVFFFESFRYLRSWWVLNSLQSSSEALLLWSPVVAIPLQ